ncbi:hypothetical protein P9112_009113 [Eukaryota sp. TZLM1-RC]
MFCSLSSRSKQVLSINLFCVDLTVDGDVNPNSGPESQEVEIRLPRKRTTFHSRIVRQDTPLRSKRIDFEPKLLSNREKRAMAELRIVAKMQKAGQMLNQSRQASPDSFTEIVPSEKIDIAQRPDVQRELS